MEVVPRSFDLWRTVSDYLPEPAKRGESVLAPIPHALALLFFKARHEATVGGPVQVNPTSWPERDELKDRLAEAPGIADLLQDAVGWDWAGLARLLREELGGFDRLAWKAEIMWESEQVLGATAPRPDIPATRPTAFAEGATSSTEPDGIARIPDVVLRGQALETWEAARFLAHAIDLWGIWLLKATPENELHVGHAFYQQNMARQAVDVLCAHGAAVPSFRGRDTEEILSWFPAVPCGPINREEDADFISKVRAAMPRLRTLQSELGVFTDRLSAAPLSALTRTQGGSSPAALPAVKAPSSAPPSAPAPTAPPAPASKTRSNAERRQDRAPAPLATAVAQRHEPDGPFEADGFRFRGAEVHFGRAAKQYGLVLALWDSDNGCPHPPRSIEDVLRDVYGENHDTEDTAFRQLCTDTRRRLEAVVFPLTIENVLGKVSLKPPPA
jgi:hypothetical protein